ncbi:hypothetical protein NQ318_003999 [Aromia moschata]|uniref:Odorant receptor n=1 Tax=Aromia moschata TaxID=1265417 RepID=A0AAV8Z8Z6_9CUCU|nr:hypothetical protein NQ318_003999 [Aromia moschata]
MRSLNKSGTFFFAIDFFLKISGAWWPDKTENKLTRTVKIAWDISLVLCACIFFVCEILVMKEISDMRQMFIHVGILFSHVLGMAKFFVIFLNQERINMTKGTLQDKMYHYESCCSWFKPVATFKESRSFMFIHLGMLCSHVLDIAKFFVVILNQKRINKVKGTLQDKLYHYESCGSWFRPGTTFKESRAFVIKFALCIFFLYYMVGVSAMVVVMINFNKDEFKHGSVRCIDLMPYRYKIPFSTPTRSSCMYAIVFMVFNIFSHAAYHGCDTLLICVRTKLQMLNEALRTIRQRTLYKMSLPKSLDIFRDEEHPAFEAELYNEMRRCAMHLESLIWICDEIESMFTFTTLGQIVTSFIVVASNMYSFVKIPITDPEIFSVVHYTAGVTAQLSIICYFGNEITEVQSMIIMMSRLQKEVYISIGKFTPLTLATLVLEWEEN